jgi:Domain of unknown function (DUF932)
MNMTRSSFISPRNTVLTNDQLARYAPSAFADSAHSSRSDRYSHIPTSRVIEALRSNGFVPTFAQQSKVRDIGRVEHAKHLIRFRRADAVPTLNGLFPEITLINSHDGSSSYQIEAGIFRLVCLNGLTTGTNYQSVRVPHKGDVVRSVIEGSFEVIAESGRAMLAADRMAAIPLTQPERLLMAEATHALRMDGASDEVRAAIEPEQFLRVRRADDRAPDLWTTFNVLQESAIRGGMRGVARIREPNGAMRRRNVSTSEVRGIDQATTLNRALWTLAERMAELKAA